MADKVVKVQVIADTSTAKQQLQDLQSQLQNISAKPIDINNESLVQANQMAVELQQNLQKAMNPNTGKLDLRVFSQTLKASNRDLSDYANALKSIGTEGEQAFLALGRTIATAEAPTSRLNAKLIKFGQTIKNTINWQISSSLIHGVMGQIQGALNYAEKLNTSLNSIRIVTGASTDKMAEFAQQANMAAKRLSTTTTQYTNASLIYYQQGLSDKEVAARTETTLKLANVSRQSVEEVSNQLTAIWNNYAEGASNLEHYADVITALGAATASSSSEIATGLEKFAAIGKTVGLSYDYATTALATITAETRQSADTVGTGLRTLFSRLQGLKLGETLEDGVNLNKYSAALQTVGVNIQDQYGKVKDMDQILDELGAKWGTISKEQQIALAQTVGGVRQYTNLIALMDNWNIFQRNLKVAQGADGTLDKQADIYGQSWEAATKRVRASIETIYDSLINDKAIIQIIDGFSGFLDLIHGITEGLGGMKGILLTVASIFLNQYAKNIPGVVQNIAKGFSQFTGIGMIRTAYGRVDSKTYQLQEQNKALMAQQASNTSLNNADRLSARGSLTLAHMNQAYQAQRRFMTPEQQAAAELRIKNTEAAFNSLSAQARQSETKKTEAETLLQENLREAQKIPKRSKEEQATLNAEKAEAERAAAEAQDKLKRSRSGTAAQETVARKAAEKEAEITERSLRGDVSEEEYARAHQEAVEARSRAEKAKQTTAAREREAIERQNAAQQAAEAAKTPEQILAEREQAAQALFESRHPGEEYITSEMVASKQRSKKAREEQQASLTENLRELNEREGLLKDTGATAEAGLGRFDYDVAHLDAARKAAWLQSKEAKELTKSGKNLDEIWAGKTSEEKGRVSERTEAEALSRAKTKGQKYRENLESAIDAKYGADSDEAKVLKSKIKESGQGIENAESVEGVQQAAAAIAQAVKAAIQEGATIEENGQTYTLQSAEARQQAIENEEDLVSAATGLSTEQLSNYGADVQAGQQGQFRQQMTFEDINNPVEPEGGENAFKTDPFSSTVTSLGAAAAAGAAFAASLSAVSNAFSVVSDQSASFAEKIGAAGAALATAKNAGDQAREATSSVMTMMGKAGSALPGWIGLAVSVASMVFGLVKGYLDKLEAEEQERRQQLMDDADEKNEEIQANKDVIDTNSDLIQSYKKMKENGASAAELAEQQTKIMETTSQLQEKYGISGLTSSVLGGKLEETEKRIDVARLQELEEGQKKSQAAKTAAALNLTGAKVKGVTGSYQYFDDGSAVLEGYYLNAGGSVKDEQKAMQALESVGLKNRYLAGANADELLDSYEKLNTAYELMKETMTLEEQKSSEVFQNSKKYLDSISDQAEAYKQYKDQIDEYDIEILGLGGTVQGTTRIGNAKEEIKDLKTYDEYRQKLIEQAAKAKGITDVNSDQYKDLVNAVDAYLGTLSNVTSNEKGNLQMISKGLDDLTEQQAFYQGKSEDTKWKEKMRAKLADLYEEYGDAIFQIDATVDLTDDASPRLKAQLDLLQKIADAQHIQVQIDLMKNFNLGDTSSAKEWAEFGKQVDNELWKSVFGEDFDINKFAALADEQQDAKRQQYMSKLNEQYYGEGGEFDQVQAEREKNRDEAQKELDAAQGQVDQYADDHQFYIGSSYEKAGEGNRFTAETVKNNSADILRARALTQAKEKGATLSADEMIELEQLGDKLKKQGIGQEWLTGDRTENSAIDRMLTLAESNEKVKDLTESVNGYNDAIEQGEAEKQAYDQFGFRANLAAEAEQWGINYDEVKQYATSLRETGQFTEDQIKESEEFALAQKKVSEGITLIKNNLSKYQTEVKAGRKASEDYKSSLYNIKKGLSGILGVPIDKISDSFVEAADSAGLLEDVMNDVDGAVDKVYQFAGDKALAEMMGISPENIANLDPEALHNYLMNNLTKGFEGLGDELQTIYDGLPEFKPGDLIDTPGMTSALDTVVNGMLNAGKSMDSILSTLGEMGIEASLVPHTGEGHGAYYATANGYKMVPNGAGGADAVPTDAIEVGTEEESSFTTYDLIYHKKGGGGGGSSGGGGGGKKEKDHKKPDTGTRYHTIKAKQSNNTQNKSEVNRKKERAFGAEKIAQAKQEIDLQKEALDLQRQYIDEITDYLAGDRQNMEKAFADLGISLTIDENGVITNFREVEEELLRQENELIDKYNDGLLDDDAYEDAQTLIDDAREYLEIYEETRDLYEEQMIAMIELLDGLQDQLLELTKTKIEIQIDISDEKLEWLEYMLEKIGDDAYQAAEAIAFLGDKTGETLNRIDIYQAGLEEILGRKGFSLDDLDNLTDLDLASANFTQAEIDQIREWKSELMDANKELLKMREEVIDKVIDGFDKLNEKVKNSYDNFNQYNDILEKYKEITDLLGLRLNQQNKELLDSLGKATLANAQNQAASAKIIYETAKKAHDDAQRTYQEMVQRYGENSPEAQQWENLINTTQDALDEAQSNWLDAWDNALQIAQEIYTTHIEQITQVFEEQVSGLFGSLDYLQSAFDRADQVGTEYLQDFEKLYELNKLNRDIQKEIDDSNNIRDKQALKKLQKEINDLQAQGVQLSQYDVDALRKKFELEQARQALEDARNNKSEVRLQRDANGNWGYVYTAAEDATKEAEQEYENKLYEYQKLNDDYIKELQSRVLETQAQYKEALAEIYSDTTLTDEQRQARIDELNAWKDAELAYFEDQLNNALQNQQDTLDLYYKIYGNSQAALADSWEETTLRMLTGAGSVEEYINNIQQAMLDMLNNSANALSDYNNDVDDTNEAAGVNTEEYATHVIDAMDEIGEASEMTQEQVAALAETLMGEFTDALAEAVKWEDEYAQKMKEAIEQNEKFIQSLNEMIARLAIIESNDPELKIARANYMLAEAKHEKFVEVNGDIYDKDWEKAKKDWQEYLDKYAAAASYDTGGYTGSWGSEGRMAILHEKENVFNADDTERLLNAVQILKTIDLSAQAFADGFGNMLLPHLEGLTQTLDQNVHIEASFPNVTDHNEIELAFENLINKASQYANRKNMSSMTFQDMYTTRF